MKRNKKNLIEKIIVKYDDGTEKEVLKGVVITNKPDEVEGEENLIFEFSNMQGQELSNLIMGTVQMGIEFGLFEDK